MSNIRSVAVRATRLRKCYRDPTLLHPKKGFWKRFCYVTYGLTRTTFLMPAMCVVWMTLPLLTLKGQTLLVLQPGSRADTYAAQETVPGLPTALARDAAGNLYVADARLHRIIRISSSGVHLVYAGTGEQGYNGDNGPAAQAQLNTPSAVALGGDGTLYIADTGNHRLRGVTTGGVITTVAGGGASGDSGPALTAFLRSPSGVAVDANGNIYVSDAGDHRVRRIGSDGVIRTVAGSGEEGDTGDNGPAIIATLERPTALTFLPDGTLLIADEDARRVRALRTDGTIAAYATGLRRPSGLAADAASTTYIADAENQQITAVTAMGSSVILGNGEQGQFLPGDPLGTALNLPAGLIPGALGTLFVADRGNKAIQQVSPGSMAFGSVPVGSASATQTLVLQNGGTTPLTVAGMVLPAGFSSTHGTCSDSAILLAPAASCSMALVFTPTAQGDAHGVAKVEVTGAATQMLVLTGSGTAAGTLSTSSTVVTADGAVNYAGMPVVIKVRVSGPLQTIPAGNVTFLDGTFPLGTVPLSSGTASFQTASLAVGAHSVTATYSGDAVYASSISAGLVHTVVAVPDFTVTAAQTSFTSVLGNVVPVSLSILPLNGTLNQPVALTIAGLPSGTTAAFDPSVPTLGGVSVPVTLTLKLPASLAASTMPLGPLLALPLLLAVVPRRKRWWLTLGTPLLLAGCGGFGGAGTGTVTATSSTAPRTYTVTVTATAAGVTGSPLVHTTALTLAVTP